MKRKICCRVFKKRNFSINKWDVYPNDPNVVGVKRNKSDSYKSLIINGHMDVAEVSADEAWETGHLLIYKMAISWTWREI